MNVADRLFLVLSRYSFVNVRSAFIRRSRLESSKIDTLRRLYTAQGWEHDDSSADPDHITIGGQRWVMSPVTKARRVSEELAAIKASREAQTRSVIGTESLSAMICPKCGDVLQHTNVCPACPTGKLGYRHRYNCVCGGVDFISKDKL